MNSILLSLMFYIRNKFQVTEITSSDIDCVVEINVKLSINLYTVKPNVKLIFDLSHF